MFTHRPEKLVPHKFNIVACRRDEVAILWRDDEYFVVADLHPGQARPISLLRAFSISAKGQLVNPDPIPLENLSEWREKAREVNIPLLPIEEQAFGAQ